MPVPATETLLWPDAVSSTTGGAWAAVGGGTILGNLSDENLATGIESPLGTGGQSIRFSVQNISIPAGTGVLGVEPFGTYSVSALVANQAVYVRLYLSGTLIASRTWGEVVGPPAGAKVPWSNDDPLPLMFKADGTPFTATDIGNLEIEVIVPAVGGSTNFRTSLWALGLRVFTTTTINPPSIVSPLGGSTVTTDTPTVTCNVQEHPQATDSQFAALAQWIEHEFATDALFTTNRRTLNAGAPPASVLNSDYAHTHQATLGAGQALTGPSLWRMRVRAVDNVGSYSAWVETTGTFTVAHPPTPTDLSPASGGAVVADGGQVVFSWTFSDPSVTDQQTAYEIMVERNSDGLVIIDTGKVMSSATQYAATIPSAYRGIDLRWRVGVYDTRDAGVGSPNTIFRVNNPPTVDVTSPLPSGTVATPTPTIVATHTSTTGATPTRMRVAVREQASGLAVYDSGTIITSTLSHTITAPLEVNTYYLVTVQVTDTDFWVASTEVPIFTSWDTPPTVPLVVDDSRHATHGHIELLWSGDTAIAGFQAWRIYRRLEGGAWTLLDTVPTLGASNTYQDWLAASNVTYEYAVTQVGVVSAEPVESARVAQAGTGTSTEYWLIHPADELLTFRLHHVTEDSFADEYEQETINLIGVGRHTDYGTHWGILGSLTAQILDFDGASARDLQLALRRLKDERAVVYLRTPFGDIWQVSTGNVDTTRVAGVGQNEYVSVTIPYTEVA